MSSLRVRGGIKLSGEIRPQGAKNEALQVICATLLSESDITISNIPDIVDRLTIPQIQQQMIMYGVDFPRKTSKKQLEAIITSADPNEWKKEVDANTLGKRFKTYTEKYGELPIVLASDAKATEPSASSSDKPPISATNEPKKDVKPETEPDDEDIILKQQPPIKIPSKANISILREHLIKAFNGNKIKDIDDREIYNKNMTFKVYVKSEKLEKDFILKNLRYLYKKYVYNPAKQENLRNNPTSPKNVKKTNVKEKTKSK